jgi:Metal-dependent hydrolase
MQTLRVATYNVHKCRGLDGRVKPARIAEVLHQVSADIVALQEVLSIPGDARELDQARYLADELGMQLATGETRKLRGGSYGNAVLTRHSFGQVSCHDLSVIGREPRGCLRADVKLERDTIVHVFNVHLGTAFLERRHQARMLLEQEVVRNTTLSGPRIVLGDFNEWTRGLTSRMLSSEFESADIRTHLRQNRTYPGVMPFMHLDHIYYDKSLIVERVTLHRTPTALIASDHLPLVADFGMRE